MAELTIRKNDDGSELQLGVGDILTVRLPATPGTGYSWNISADAGGMVTMAEPSRFESISKIHAAGAEEEQMLKLRVCAAGEGLLRLEYRQAWDKISAAANSFAVKVMARS